MADETEVVADLKPWMRGPYELIRHADGHLKDGGDTDRRVALIGFDNAIEVSIDVFIGLHPRLRGGIELTHDEREKALRNYHTKIEFLDQHVESRQIPLSTSVEAILWYHQLRNELYHSGNGMVPELHVIEGARAACLAVFKALFGIEADHFLGGAPPPTKPPTAPIIPMQNDAMEFLRWYIELERLLVDKTRSERGPRTVMSAWRTLREVHPQLGAHDERVRRLTEQRNAIVHGKTLGMDAKEVEAACEAILEVMDDVEKVPTTSRVMPH
ncbi:MAG: hypothetical protein V2A73_17725 [Pseudomonadota bacterium]